MTRLPGTIGSLLRSSQSLLRASVHAPPRTSQVQATFSTGHSQSISENCSQSHTTSRESNVEVHFAAHLDSVFRSLEFPPELARRILTHGSHKAAIHGHNGRLGFIGRRVLESYYLLFIHEAVQGHAHQDYDRLVSRALNTYLLGEHVAPRWSLGRVLLWVPTVSKETLQAAQTRKPDSELDEALAASPGIAKSVGLYKVMGEAVQAVVGGVYHQFGGSAAHRLFHTRILPHLLLPGRSSGVPDEYHTTALRICDRMGGPECNLLYHVNTPEHTEDGHVSISSKRRVATIAVSSLV